MKTLELNLGVIKPQQAESSSYIRGWYLDPQTGEIPSAKKMWM